MLLELVIILALILLNGFFSLAEMAVVSARKARLRHESNRGKINYRLALETAENPSTFLSSIQVVITLIGTLAGAFGGATVAGKLQQALTVFPALAASAKTISVGLVVLCTSFVSVILGELVPKNIALANPERTAAAVIRPVRFFTFVFSPVSRFLSKTTDLIVRVLGGKRIQGPAVTEEEVRVLIAQGAKDGIFADSEREMVEGVLDLDDRRITSLMTPRIDMAYIDLEEGVDEAKRVLLDNINYSDLPVVEGDLEKVMGTLPVKIALAALVTRGLGDIASLLQKPLFLSDAISPLKAFAAMKSAETKTAFILDEYGGVLGIIALADILESVMGDLSLRGEDDDEPKIVRRDDGSFLVDGSMPIADFVKELGLDEKIEEGDYDTVAGLVLHLMEKIPHEGDRCTWDGCSLEVVDMDGNRIDKVLVTLVGEESGQ